jgi:hypothetical protein
MVMELQPELLEIQLGQLMAPPVSHAGAPYPPKEGSLLRTSGLGLLQHQSHQVQTQNQRQTQEEETIVCSKPNNALMHSHSPMDRPQLHQDPPRQKV